jgi:hypothetical protein
MLNTVWYPPSRPGQHGYRKRRAGQYCMDDKPHRGENDIARRGVRISLMTAQGREPPLEVRYCDSGLDESLPPSKVFFSGCNIPFLLYRC